MMMMPLLYSTAFNNGASLLQAISIGILSTCMIERNHWVELQWSCRQWNVEEEEEVGEKEEEERKGYSFGKEEMEGILWWEEKTK